MCKSRKWTSRRKPQNDTVMVYFLRFFLSKFFDITNDDGMVEWCMIKCAMNRLSKKV